MVRLIVVTFERPGLAKVSVKEKALPAVLIFQSGLFAGVTSTEVHENVMLSTV
mgnify:CR=1 FL=1